MSSTQRILIVLGLAVLAALILAFAYKTVGSPPPADDGLIAVTDDVFGGPFTLTDHNGRPVTEKSWPGKYKLMYFGFTYCPAICPTELQKITAALNKMGGEANAVQPLFITVDPERDTASKMKSYLSSFHPSIIGLTGTQEQVGAMLKAYKIYAAKVQDPSLNDYTMDHSTFVYLIAPDGRLLHIFKLGDTADDFAQVMKAWIGRNSPQ